MYPTFQKKFKVICQDVPYLQKKFQSNLSSSTIPLKNIEVIPHQVPHTNIKVIHQKVPYLPKKISK